jgi:hypothetical protein
MGKRRKKPKPAPQRRKEYEDAWQTPTAKRWIEHVLNDMEPKLADSAFSVSLVPDDREGDVKWWVELGASIMYDKPIIAVVFNNRPIPEKLKLVADEIVRCPNGVDELAGEKMQAAMKRVIDRLEQGGRAA